MQNQTLDERLQAGLESSQSGTLKNRRLYWVGASDIHALNRFCSSWIRVYRKHSELVSKSAHSELRDAEYIAIGIVQPRDASAVRRRPDGVGIVVIQSGKAKKLNARSGKLAHRALD